MRNATFPPRVVVLGAGRLSLPLLIIAKVLLDTFDNALTWSAKG